MSKILSKNNILALAKKRNEPVEVEVSELDGKVFVRQITAGEWEQLEKHTSDSESKPKVRATVIAFSACDDKGNLLFDDSDIELINQLPFAVVKKIFTKANEINGLNVDDGDIEKN